MKKLLRFLMLMALMLPFALQAQVSLPISNGFENESDLSQWTLANCISGTGISSTYAHEGSSCFAFHWTTNPSQYLISPEFDEASGTEMISFWYANTSSIYSEAFEVGFSSTTNDTTAFTWSSSVAVATSTPWTEYSLPIPAGTKYIAIKSTAYDQYYLLIDDLYIGEAPTCFKVTNLAIVAAQTTSNSMTLTWADEINTDATYNIFDMSDTSLIESGVSGLTYTITDLDANTLYSFGVQADCGSDGIANGYTTVSGRTSCAPYELPFNEDFSVSLATNPCWNGATKLVSEVFEGESLTLGNISGWSYQGSAYNGIEAGHYNVNIYGLNCKYWMITPEIDLTSASSPLLSFDAAFTKYSGTAIADGNIDDDKFMVLISTDGGLTWNSENAIQFNLTSLASTSYIPQYVDLTEYAGETVRIAFYAESTVSGGDNNLHIDNILIEESTGELCLPVNNLTSNDITAHEATLNWVGTADSYTIIDMSDSTEVITVYETSYTITDLAPETQYSYGVKANCSSSQSVTITTSFTTLIACSVPTGLTAVLTPGDGTIATLNWNEVGAPESWQICFNGDTINLIDVDEPTYDLTDLTPETTYTAMVRANCGDLDGQSQWSNTITFTPTDAYSLTLNDGTTTNGYVPIYGSWVDNITKSQFVIPATDLVALQFGAIDKLTFYASNDNVSWGNAEFEVYMTETDETTLSSLVDYNGMSQVYAGSLSITNNTMEITFSDPYLYLGGNLLIGFLQTATGTWSSCSWYGVTAEGASFGGYGSSISQRNFLPKTTIYFIPGDEDICLPVTGQSVSDITENSATLTWDGTADSYTIIDLSDTSEVATVYEGTYEFTDLIPMTQYSFGIVANCGNDQSLMKVVNFNTACAAVDLPFTETFETTSTSRNCWTLVSNNTTNVGGSNGMGFVTINNRQTLRFSSYSNASDYNQYGFSPVFNASSDATYLLVNVLYATYGSTDLLNFGYVTETDTVWDPTTYTTTGSSDFQMLELVIPTTATQLAIHYYGDYKFYAWIDTVEINEMTGEYCYSVSNLSVDAATSNSVTLSWTDDNNTGITYTVYNGNDVVATNIAETSYVVTDLSPSSTYTFGVVANCSADNESAMKTISASTDCGAITSYPYIQEFNSAPDCWTAIDADGDGYNWELYSGSIQSASYDNNTGALTPDNWLISPQFTIPTTGNYEVTWSVTAQDQSWPAEHYGVFISTTGNNNTDDFTMIQEWTLATGVFNPIINLNNYAGQDIYIALRHFDCTDQFRISVDEFIVREQAGANQVTINVGQNNPSYGTVTGAGIYNIGDDVTVTATPASGYEFSKWVDETNSEISTDNPYTFVAATDLTLNAIFVDAYGTTYTITVEVNDSTMGTATGGGEYIAGEMITLTATPFSGYTFVNWTQESSFGINVVGTEPELIITVTGDKTFIANFEAGSGPVITNPTVTTEDASGVEQTVAILNATITNPSDVTISSKGFEWKTTMGGSYQSVTGTGTGNTFTYNLSNLSPNTSYTYKAFIIYNGNIIYGDEVTFTTLEQGVDPCEVPTGLAASDITKNSFTVTWNANPNATGYVLRYRPATGDWTSVTPTNNSHTLTGLTPDTQYEVQVQSNCGGGNISDWSASLNVSTLVDGIPTHLINSIALYPNPAKDYVDVRVDDNDVNVNSIEVYDVYGKMINTVNVVENPTRINVSGLANGMYFVRVTTENGAVTKTFVKQ